MQIHFDNSVSLGNIFAVLAFLAASMFAWRDLNWRVKNLESWKDDHAGIAATALNSLNELKTIAVELKTISAGQERRITMLEQEARR